MPQNETETFQHYQVLKNPDGSLWELGHGAMGVTYKAIDTKLQALVALKIINAQHLNDNKARARFVREARAAAALRHRNVASVYYLGDDDQSFFYAMEFVDGKTVEKHVASRQMLESVEALQIAAQVARALMAAHEKQLIHRDLKPANLMLVKEVDEDALVVKVIDFGLARPSTGGEGSAHITLDGFVGTPQYASPEQLEEKDLDARSDIYSLGVTLWYMLAGRPPFVGSLGKVMAQHLYASLPWEQLPPGLPKPVRALLARMLAKDREQRPQTPAELRREIEKCLRDCGASITASPPIPVEEPASDDAATQLGEPSHAEAPTVGSEPGEASHAEPPQTGGSGSGSPVAECRFFRLRALGGLRGWVRACAFSRDSQQAAFGGTDRVVQFWKVAGRCVADDQQDYGASLYALAANPARDELAAAGAGGSVKLWVGPQRTPRVLTGHDAGVLALAYHPGGKWLASGAKNGALIVWDAGIVDGPGIPIPVPANGAEIQALAYSPDGRTLAAGDTRGMVHRWACNPDGMPQTALPGFKADESFVSALAFLGDGASLATGGGQALPQIWDLKASPAPRARSLPGHEKEIVALAVNRPLALCAVASLEGCVRVCRFDGQPVGLLHANEQIHSLAFSPDGRLLITGGSTGRAQLWRIEPVMG
jgi:serine/threonine protein kinase